MCPHCSRSKFRASEGRNLLLIAFLVIVVQGSDICQYIAGKVTRDFSTHAPLGA